MTNKKIIPKFFHFIVVLLLVSAWGGPISIGASEEHVAKNLLEEKKSDQRFLPSNSNSKL